MFRQSTIFTSSPTFVTNFADSVLQHIFCYNSSSYYKFSVISLLMQCSCRFWVSARTNQLMINSYVHEYINCTTVKNSSLDSVIQIPLRTAIFFVQESFSHLPETFCAKSKYNSWPCDQTRVLGKVLCSCWYSIASRSEDDNLKILFIILNIILL